MGWAATGPFGGDPFPVAKDRRLGVLSDVFGRFYPVGGARGDDAAPRQAGARAVLTSVSGGREVTLVCRVPAGAPRREAFRLTAVVAEQGRVFFEECVEGAARRFDVEQIEQVIGAAGETLSPTLLMMDLGVCGIELACVRNAWAQTPAEVQQAALDAGRGQRPVVPPDAK